MSDQNLVRIGLVETSNNVIWNHIPPLHSHSQAKFWAICGRNPEHTAEVASEFSIPRAYTNYQEMIESGELDAVVVAAPDDVHFPITITALQAVLHVLC